MDLGLTDKLVFLTGASGGIGRALAERFAAEGARLALHGHARAGELAAWLAAQPWRERARLYSGDVRDPGAMDAALQSAARDFGRVDACIANAGAWTPPDRRLHEADVERIRTAIDINLLGSLWTARAFFAALARSGPRSDGHGASLVFIGSTAGRFGEAGHAEYAAAKAGLLGLMSSLKNEIVTLDPFARVNVVEPGWTVTHMARPALQQPGVIAKALATMPVRQLGRAQDVAATVAWLCSPLAARHVSGQVLTVAGGMEGRQLWAAADIDEESVRRRATS
ncbi:MAG: SDR family NAD(P)-dependent oxidoreductase [Planctomycetota bacterium]